jgi:hypothetical protein
MVSLRSELGLSPLLHRINQRVIISSIRAILFGIGGESTFDKGKKNMSIMLKLSPSFLRKTVDTVRLEFSTIITS